MCDFERDGTVGGDPLHVRLDGLPEDPGRDRRVLQVAGNRGTCSMSVRDKVLQAAGYVFVCMYVCITFMGGPRVVWRLLEFDKALVW